MANILDYKHPVSGAKGNALNLVGLWQMILGVFIVLVAWTGGMALMGTLKGFIPAQAKAIVPTATGWHVAGDE